MAYFKNLGYGIVGNPSTKSINMNGADIVATMKDAGGNVIKTLCVECKEVSTSVNLGTLGKNALNMVGGSTDQVLRTAGRLANTSNEQLKAEFDAVKVGQTAGNLKNALYTSAEYVSEGAKKAFDYVVSSATTAMPSIIKGIETISSRILNLPMFLVPAYILDPNNMPYIPHKEPV